jgi:medium-chain acyl-[acyl-carrier-protein] hydrolase
MIELWAVQLPGHETRLGETPRTAVEAVVTELVTILAASTPAPFAVFGHSLGSLLAFELTRALRRAGGGGPRHLFVSGRRAPHLALSAAPLHGLPDGTFIDAVSARYGGIPEAVRREPDLMALFLPILRADCRMAETYRYQPETPLEVPIMAFGGFDDREETPPFVEAWSAHTTSGFLHETLPGDHFYPWPSQERLLRRIAEQLLSLE